PARGGRAWRSAWRGPRRCEPPPPAPALVPPGHRLGSEAEPEPDADHAHDWRSCGAGAARASRPGPRGRPWGSKTLAAATNPLAAASALALAGPACLLLRPRRDRRRLAHRTRRRRAPGRTGPAPRAPAGRGPS